MGGILGGARSTYDLVGSLAGETYSKVLSYALTCCRIGLLVELDFDLSERGHSVLRSLEPHLIEKKREKRWPGTVLLNSEATVLRFNLTRESMRVVSRATDHLYGWRQPELPEDLCLLRGDGTEWLASIAHEDDGYFNLSDDEFRSLCTTIPQIRSMLSKAERPQ